MQKSDNRVEELLRYARGETQLKKSYLAFYDVSETGVINIHSCKRISGCHDHLIRFADFTGKKIEPKVSDDLVFKEIERFMLNSKTA